MVAAERAGRETISTKFQKQEPPRGLHGVASVRLELRQRERDVGGEGQEVTGVGRVRWIRPCSYCAGSKFYGEQDEKQLVCLNQGAI